MVFEKYTLEKLKELSVDEVDNIVIQYSNIFGKRNT